MPPGPIIIGMASGTTAMAPIWLDFPGWMVISLLSLMPTSGLAGLLLPFIIEMAISSTKMPPPT